MTKERKLLLKKLLKEYKQTLNQSQKITSMEVYKNTIFLQPGEIQLYQHDLKMLIKAMQKFNVFGDIKIIYK